MKLLTISIAAYNVEKYLEQTLNSLADNRYINDLEILIIDDGSKDRTGDIAKNYQDRFPDSIKYVSKENGGHGSTINTGIRLASGRYFRIIDGDDYVDCDSFYEYVRRLKSSSEDMIITDLRAVDDAGNKRIDPGVLEKRKNPFDSLKENEISTIKGNISTRVFGLSTVTVKTDLLQKNKVQITENCFYVDVEFVIWCVYLSENFVYWSLPVYMYRKDPRGDNSVSKKNMIKNIEMQKKVVLKLCALYELFLSNGIDESRRSVVLKRIAISVGAAMRTYMLSDISKESRTCIICLDKEISKNKRAYADLNTDWFIRLIRAHNYIFIPFIRMAYKLYIRIG